MRKFLRDRLYLSLLILLLCVSYIPASTVFAAQPARGSAIRAGVYVNPPFVIAGPDGTFSGMAVDLWKQVADNLHLSVQYIEYPTVEGLLSAVQRGEVDVAASNLFVTYERAQMLRFSYPWYDTGLRIMVNEDAPADVWGQLKRSGSLEGYAVIFLLLIVMTIVWTLFRRRYDMAFPSKWRDGLSMNFYELLLAARSGRVDARYFGWIGYVISTFWMLFGVVVIAYVTSTVTSAMTAATLQHEINSIRDLPGRTVGVLHGGAEQVYLRRFLIQTMPYEHIEDMVEALQEQEIEAAVADSPILEYWLHTHPQSRNEIVGGLFFPNKYAFAANAKHAQLIEAVSMEIIRLQESGMIRSIRDEYFGNSGI